eukprot:scaffold21_cov107-Cylindrotheca_fusiformis.AAC.11
MKKHESQNQEAERGGGNKKQEECCLADIETAPAPIKESTPRQPPPPLCRLKEFYCIALLVVLFFVLGLLTGHYGWESKEDSSRNKSKQATNQTCNSTTILPHVTVGAYYYPWYGNDFHHGDGYLRKRLQLHPQEPMLGEYNDTDPAVIAQHLQWSRRANIDLWVTSWWGPGSREDNTTRSVILEHEDLLGTNHRIALLYETFGRIRREENYNLERLRPDVEYICETYFDHPNYFRIDDRPVLFLYLTRALDDLGILQDVVTIMRQSIQKACQKNVYIVADQIFGPTTASSFDDSPFRWFDAATNYDVYGSLRSTLGEDGVGYVKEEQVEYYYQFEQRHWREQAKKQGCAYIPSLSPGYNDLGVRSTTPRNVPLSRSLFQQKPGSFFQVALKNARSLLDSEAHNLLMINSFNEWHEDTQIEPVIGASTDWPYTLTNGMEYHGYGYLYLDILRNGTQPREYFIE